MEKSFRCIVCGYIHVGNEPPEKCVICGADSSQFEFVEVKVQKADKTENNEGMHIVIVGAGIAGISAAEEIRKNSASAKITIISKEKYLPYYRINLSRYIAKEIEKGKIFIHPESWYSQNNIKIILDKEVIDINRKNKEVTLSDDSSVLNYDKLIIASGANPFIPHIDGMQYGNVVTLRTLEDAEKILNSYKNIKSCICIGAGILGIEVCGAIAKNGIKVTMISGSEWLMPKQLNKNAAHILQKHMEAMNVYVKENAKVKQVLGTDGCFSGVQFDNGEILEADLLIVTTGVEPNLEIVKKANLGVNRGLIVNNRLQTSDENILAAGDVSEHDGVVYGLWNAAQFQGKIAGLNALGIETNFGGIERSNVLKAVGIDIFSIGEISSEKEGCTTYEEQHEDKYYYFVLGKDKIIGSIIIGDNQFAKEVKRAVENGLNFKEIVDNINK